MLAKESLSSGRHWGACFIQGLPAAMGAAGVSARHPHDPPLDHHRVQDGLGGVHPTRRGRLHEAAG